MFSGTCIALLIFLGLPAALLAGYQWGRAEQRRIVEGRPYPLHHPISCAGGTPLAC